MTKIVRKKIYEPSEQIIPGSGSGNSTATFFADASTISVLPAVTYLAGVLTATANGVLPSQDGVTLTVGQILLVRNQASTLQNGLYEVTDLGSAGTPFILTRPTYYDETAEIYPSQVNILGGTTQAGKYYLETTVDPIIGTNPITYIAVSQAQIGNYTPLSFVDTVADTALPNTPTYLSGTTLVGNPGYLATYTSSTNTIFPTLQGLTPFVGMKVLVAGEADQTKNGNYQLVTLGGATTKWQLRRIFYTGSQFYPILIEVLASNYKGYIYQQNNKTLVNATIGTVGNITFTNIGQLANSGIWGIANSSGIYTYYSTLTLAMTAATSGKCIEMFTDVTESGAVTIQLKDGVNIDGHGHTYTFTNNSVSPFNDFSTAPVNSINNFNLIATTYTGYAFTSSGITYGSGFNIRSTLGQGALINSGGKLYKTNSKCLLTAINIASGGEAYNVYGESTLSTSDGLTASIINYGNLYNSVAKRLNGSIGTNLWATNGSGYIYNCTFYSVGNQCAIGGYFYNCNVKTLGDGGFYDCLKCANCTSVAGTRAYVSIVNLYESEGISDSLNSSYGTVDNCTKIRGGTFTCTGLGSVITRSYDIKEAEVINQWNNVAGHGINVDNTNSIITNCDIEVTNSTACCILSSTSCNVQYALNTFSGATTPLLNIVQYINVGNTLDSQGNININH